jgi:hypothetical protein
MALEFKNNVEIDGSVSAKHLSLDTTLSPAPNNQGDVYFDQDEKALQAVLNGYRQVIGGDIFYPVTNQSGSSIAKGAAVQFAGTLGASGRLLIAPFLADGSVQSSFFMGVAAETIANGDEGKVLWFGRIRGINTSSFSAGDVLYASTTNAGGYQTAVPQAPNNIVQVAAVINSHVNQGVIFVRPTIGSNINKDEGVKITSPTTNDILQLQANGLWENKTKAQLLGGTSGQFVKGDGSLDGTAYTPTSRTLTAGDGLTGGGNLTANRTFTLGIPSSITLSSTNSVTTASHSHEFAPGGTTSQYLRGDGSLATFPTIGDGTLTLATSGIATGSATFKANQTGGSTFTVNVPATNIAQGTRTATEVPITSSTGTNATLDIATTSLAGVMSASDKTKLDGIAANANNYTHPNHTGDVTSAGDGATTIANNAVTNAKFRQSAGFSVVGKTATGTGNVADIVAGTNGVLRRSGSGNLEFGTLVTGNIGNSQVTLAKIANIAANTILGNNTGGAAAPIALTAAQVRTLINVADGATANTGTVTSIIAGDGLSGGTITTSGTIAVDSTVVRTTGNQTIGGNKTFDGTINTIPRIAIQRNFNVSNGISWYNSSTFKAWATYMSPAGTANTGPTGNITAPSGTLVTSWALRNYIENAGGYGWTFESGSSSQTTPTVVAEIRSSDGSARFGGTVTIGTQATTTSHAVRADRTITVGSSSAKNLTSNVSFTLGEIGAQASLTNPITGTGSSGQVSFFNGTTTQTGDNGLFWDNNSKGLSIIGNNSFLDVWASNASGTATIQLRTTNSAGTSVPLSNISSTGDIGGGTRSRLMFSTRDSSGTIQERVRIDSSGNVGIGTTSPSAKLDVQGNIQITKSLLSNQENLTVDTGALRLIAQISSTNHDAVFFDYVIKKGNDLRAGTVYAVHNGTDVEFTETSTNDIGNTNEVVLSVDISGGNVRLLAKTDTNGWQIKTLTRGI